jgi:voltage-gated potassium channel
MSHRHIDRFHLQLGPFRASAYRVLQFAVLMVGLVAMIIMTVPGLRPDVQSWLSITLWICLLLFTADLVIGAWPGSARPGEPNHLFTAAGAIDVLGVVPIPIALLAGVPPDTAWLLASLWLLKLTAMVPGFSLLGRVIALEARPLGSVLVIFLIVLLLAATALFILERANQPQHFGSLPLALWWAVTTLTTTGYGDSVPQSFLGRLIAGMVMISGLGVFGLWAGILANGFAAEHRRRDFMRNWNLVTRVPFLRNLDPPALIALTRMLRPLDLAPKTVVVRRGQPGDCMYFIASGEVEVKVEPKTIRLGAGAFFGEIALLKETTRTATVMTTSPSTLLMLEVADFRDFVAHHPELATALERESERRAKVSGEAGGSKHLADNRGYDYEYYE